jgi:hypothetical protein
MGVAGRNTKQEQNGKEERVIVLRNAITRRVQG